MPRFEPFTGWRYRAPTTDISSLICPPYDVIAEDERVELESREVHNAVRLELPQANGPAGDRYHGAAQQVARWREEGALVLDDTPSFYVYRMSYADDAGRERSTTGVIGALGLEPPGEGDVLPHERTTPKAKSDRLDLLRATTVNLSPVWGLSLAKGLSARLGPPAGAPDATARADGVQHDLWRIDDPDATAAIRACVASEPVVIADGHHRYEVALAFQREHPEVAGAGAILAFVVELVEHQLTVQAIHRLLDGLPPGFDVAAALGEWFEPVGEAPLDAGILDRMEASGALALVTAQGGTLLRPKPETAATAEKDLDSSRLDVALAGLPPHEVSFQHGWANVAGAVRSGAAQAGVLLRPATVAQITEVAHARDRMPPKTTFFAPKLATGMVFRDLTSG